MYQTNYLEQVIKKYPNENYDWIALSLNPSISFEFILNNKNLPWNIPAVSKNSSINEKIVRDNLEFPWSYRDLCSNPNISFDFFLEYTMNKSAKVDLNWNELSKNPSIVLDTIDKYYKYPWNDRYISSNTNISSNYILNLGRNRNWFIPAVSMNKGIKEKDIYKKLIDFNYNNLSSNPNLPAKYIYDNLNKDWNFYNISCNPNITITDIELFHKIPWDYNGLSLNKNINIKYVLSKKEKDWNIQSLLSNSAITLEDIENNLNYFDNVNYNKETFMCSNSNINLKWIEKNIRFIDWKKLSRNSF